LKNYEIEDHFLWHCEKLETERRCLTDALTVIETAWESCPGFVCFEKVAGEEGSPTLL
jgi:hypothetical protein